MPGTDIFLSYARQDRPTARVFAECMADEGFSVWWDASLHSGETFDEVIERNLRDAKAVVVLWSPASVASRWVRAEATLADRRDKLAPAIIEPCDRPIIFELKHAAELSGWTGDRSDVRWRSFVRDLHRLVGAAGDKDLAAAEKAPAALKTADGASGHAAANRQPLPPGNDDGTTGERNDRETLHRSAGREAPPGDSHVQGEVHCLDIEDGDRSGDSFVVESTGVKIGRAAPADLILPHKSISREHCIIGLANDELLVTDLNSTNGTYVDGERITRATVLPVGSVVKLGQVSLKHAIRTRGEAGKRRPQGLPEGRLAATS